jgi:predicted ATPase
LLLYESKDQSVAAAEQCFNKALEVARRQGALFWELRTAVGIARLRTSQDRPDDAHHALASVYEKFTEGFATSDLRRAKAMMVQLSVR